MISHREGRGYCEEVALRELARQYQTPLYVYSKSRLLENAQRFQQAFKSYPVLPCYAVKANSNLHILRLLVEAGFGNDIVSGGELTRSLKAGCDPKKIVYSGVGKTEAEIVQALEQGILSFNVESTEELEQIQKVAAAANKVAPISLRINPNIEVKTHPHIATGLYCTKFGIDEAQARKVSGLIKASSHLKWVGLACHIGSQIQETKPYQQAARRMVELATEFRANGFPLDTLDLGGGYGVKYSTETPPDLAEFARAILDEVAPSKLRLLLEPGRVIVANSGVLLTQVLLTKTTPEKKFVVVDAAMNDLIRPALYEAHHPIEVETQILRPVEKVDVVGPVCESGDFLAQDRDLPAVQSGEHLVVHLTGAYGMAMASNYNSRGRAAEVLVEGTRTHLIRRRESIEDLMRPELI